MTKHIMPILLMLSFCLVLPGCSSNQSMKNAWKSTRGAWYTYISPPAYIDYKETGDLPKYEMALSEKMMGIDVQLTQLEKTMSNADKPPTQEWMSAFFARFPWVSGFAGIKADGQIIGQEPSIPLKPLDFTPLLEEDKKQHTRALRSYVQDTPMGPEIHLAAPLYDAHTFLGIVVASFDMRNMLRYSSAPEDIIVISPEAVLWAGKYNYESTPLAQLVWKDVVHKASMGTASSNQGTFFWVVRYLANQPLIFAVSVSGAFEEKNNTTQGPTSDKDFTSPIHPKPTPVTSVTPVAPVAHPVVPAQRDPNEILPGSSESVLLPSKRPSPFGPKPTPEKNLD